MTVKNSAEGTLKNSTIIALILVACFSRLIPHPPNFTAIGAMALFAGAHLGSKRVALLVPLAAMFFSDLVLGLHPTMVFVYVSVALITLLGRWSWQRWQGRSLIGMSLVSSLLFFVITNFGVWLTGGYEHSLQGLVTCFALAIPFFSYQVLGDLLFTSMRYAVPHPGHAEL
jgi:hypothetical protein